MHPLQPRVSLNGAEGIRIQTLVIITLEAANAYALASLSAKSLQMDALCLNPNIK